MTSWTNNVSYPFEVFTSSGSNITAGQNTTGLGICYHDITPLVSGCLYKLVQTVTLNSGTAPYFGYGTTTSLSSGNWFNGVTTDGFYKSSDGWYSRVGYRNNSSEVSNFEIADFSFKRVTDPPSTGIHIYTTATGSTRGWATQDAGFDYDESLDMVVTPGR